MLENLKEFRETLFSSIEFLPDELLRINKHKGSLEHSITLMKPLFSFSGTTVGSTAQVQKPKEIWLNESTNNYQFSFVWRGKKVIYELSHFFKLLKTEKEPTDGDLNESWEESDKEDELTEDIFIRNKRRIALHFANSLEQEIYFIENKHKMVELKEPEKKEKIVFAEICRDFFKDKLKVNESFHKSVGTLRFNALKLDLEKSLMQNMWASKAMITEQMAKRVEDQGANLEKVEIKEENFEADFDILDDLDN